MMSASRGRILVASIIVAAAIIAAAIYFTFDPEQPGSFFPRCMFLTITGYKCPGCGSQRAIHALLHADIATALKHNAALLIFIPAIAAYAVAEWQRKAWPGFYATITRPAIVGAIFTLIVAWWVLRNVFAW